MAREHVYPVCKPGSKTFTPKNKIEGGESVSSGNLLLSETEDPDVSHNEIVGGNSAGDFHSNGFLADTDKYSEFLFDLSLPPQTDQVVDGGGTEGIYKIFPWQWGSSVQGGPTAEVHIWELVNNKSWYDTFPPAGSIFCIGFKTAPDSAWRNRVFIDFNIYAHKFDENGYPYGDKAVSPFGDEHLANDHDGFFFYAGKWLTYMFTGTRFVFLGSNNWV